MIDIDFSHIKEDDLGFWYQGKFEDDLTYVLIDMLSSTESNLGKFKKRISFLVTESFQNVIRHGKTELEKSSSFALFKRMDNVHIFSSNIIDANEVGPLEEKLALVNELDETELKVLFREALQSEGLNDKGGAGIGLIDMARKTGSDLQYDFRQDAHQVEFNLQLDRSIEITDTSQVVSVADTAEFSRYLRDNSIIFLFKGELGNETTDNISRILMKNALYNEDLGGNGKSFFHVAIEMLQNMMRHGKKEDSAQNGVFIVQIEDNKLTILTKNYIQEDDGNRLNALLDEMNGLNSDELSQLYKKQLKYSILNDEKSAGVGIIDIMRCTNGNLSKRISEKEDNLELTLTATIHI